MIAENIKNLRKINSFTQQQLANKLNIDRTTVSSWERGNSEPSLNMLKKLKEVFSVTYDDLLE